MNSKKSYILTFVLFVYFLFTIFLFYQKLENEYFRTIRSMLAWLYFLPSLILFLIFSLLNFKKSHQVKDKIGIFLSGIIIIIILTYFLFLIIKLILV